MEPLDFIAMIVDDARMLQKEYGIFASVTIAQACLETGYGNYQPVDRYSGKQSYNLFGVKGEGTNGYVICQTWEVYNGVKQYIDAKFRAYNNYYESLADHNKVLLLPRYLPVRNAANGVEAAMQLHPCGYATDPDYGAKLVSIQSKFNLYQYDEPLEDEMLYTVYQGYTDLGSFHYYANAVEEAKKWSGSYVVKISDGSWVWAFPVEDQEEVVIDEPQKEMKDLDATTIEEAKKAIDKLAEAGLLNSPEYWKERVEESLPVWAYMIMESRKMD